MIDTRQRPHRRPFTRRLTFLILWAGCLVAAGPARADEQRPNVVVIFADDMGIGDVGCYNPQSKIPTPNIDRLAAGGMRFTNAYSAAAVCVPSRYALLTGRYPFRGHPLRWRSHPTIPEGTTTIASLMQEAGYATACVGKWHAGFDGGVGNGEQRLTGGPLDRGFGTFFGQHGSLDQPPYFYVHDRHAVQPATETTPGSQEEGFTIKYQGRFWREGRIAPNFDHDEVLDRYADQAVGFLKQRRKVEAAEGERAQPFFLYFPLTAPHGPWLPGERYRGKSDAGPLGDFVVHVDAVVGRVLQAVDAGGWSDDTLVIFSSDNGPLWFDPDTEKWGHDSSGGHRGQKGDVWEGGIRMPFLVRWPGHVPADTTSDEIVGLVDVLGTLAALVDADLPDDAGVDSYDLLPAMLGEKGDGPIRESLLLQSLGPNDLAVRAGPWKLIPWRGSGGFLAPAGTRVRKRFDPPAGEPKGQLYNLEDDPAEQENLYAKHPEVVERLSKLLEQYRNSQRTRP